MPRWRRQLCKRHNRRPYRVMVFPPLSPYEKIMLTAAPGARLERQPDGSLLVRVPVTPGRRWQGTVKL